MYSLLSSDNQGWAECQKWVRYWAPLWMNSKFDKVKCTKWNHYSKPRHNFSFQKWNLMKSKGSTLLVTFVTVTITEWMMMEADHFTNDIARGSENIRDWAELTIQAVWPWALAVVAAAAIYTKEPECQIILILPDSPRFWHLYNSHKRLIQWKVRADWDMIESQREDLLNCATPPSLAAFSHWEGDRGRGGRGVGWHSFGTQCIRISMLHQQTLHGHGPEINRFYKKRH